MALNGLEDAAISVLKRAVELDTRKRWTEALICYEQGLQLMMETMRSMANDSRRQAFKAKANEYMTRAELLKSQIENEKKLGKYHEQIHIRNGSKGYSYQSVMGRFCDNKVTKVEIEDPYVRNVHQTYNFLRLCELLVSKCSNLKRITLTTGVDSGGRDSQNRRFDEIRTSLNAQGGIDFLVNYSETLHDREIRLDNGWVIKIGRGLDYFKAPEGKFALGYCDYDLRSCHETTVDIFYKRSN